MDTNKVYCKNCHFCNKYTHIILTCNYVLKKPVYNKYNDQLESGTKLNDLSCNKNGDCKYYVNKYYFLASIRAKFIKFYHRLKNKLKRPKYV